jgi:hypothetical protein
MNFKAAPVFWSVWVVAVLYQSPLAATEPLRTSQDIERLCRLSAPVEPAATPEMSSEPKSYHRERRRLVQSSWEIVVPASQLTVLRYDRVTATLTVGGFKDLPLFDGAYHLRLREGCGLYFELDEARAEDVLTRARLGEVSLQFSFFLDPHDDYERAICTSENDDSREQGETVGSGASPRKIVHVDLLAAALVDTDGATLAEFRTERDHEVHLRRVSQAIGAASAVRPSVEVTSISREVRDEEERWRPVDEVTQTYWSNALEQALFPCYVRGLRRNGRLQGAMVLRVPARGQAAVVLLDTLQVDELSQCVLERVEELRLAGAAAEETSTIKATLLFRLN